MLKPGQGYFTSAAKSRGNRREAGGSRTRKPAPRTLPSPAETPKVLEIGMPCLEEAEIGYIDGSTENCKIRNLHEKKTNIKVVNIRPSSPMRPNTCSSDCEPESVVVGVVLRGTLQTVGACIISPIGKWLLTPPAAPTTPPPRTSTVYVGEACIIDQQGAHDTVSCANVHTMSSLAPA
ncbi:hypothetical protein BDW02DRAFT_359763 [Decorospora gaudefroyi]|uniref:Uncharacterized protein n=1 Tax=Decorospora gaudefroyi TaxID=184978 RepID=A0A6A5K8Y0_9PLEO|nr:hypothetical protein BDW02DRAFT_359763 [Decorospora gaudefroyi]